MDANKEEITTLKERTRHMKAVLSGGVELFMIYFRLGELNEQQSYEDTELRVELVDRATEKTSNIGIEGEWRSWSVVFWLDRGEETPKEAVGKVHRQRNAVQGCYVLEVDANMDSALLVLVCAVLDDAMRTARLKEADRRMNGFNSQFSGAYVPQTTF